MRIDPHAQVVTCGYCRLSSFVHLPNRPDPRPQAGTANYGHIHVQQRALRQFGIVLALAFGLPILFAVVMVLFVSGVFCVAISTSGPSRPPPAPAPAPAPPRNAPATPADGRSCEKAVACCKVVMNATGTKDASQLRACEAIRALDDAQCAQQLDSFKRSAESMRQTCP